MKKIKKVFYNIFLRNSSIKVLAACLLTIIFIIIGEKSNIQSNIFDIAAIITGGYVILFSITGMIFAWIINPIKIIIKKRKENVVD